MLGRSSAMKEEPAKPAPPASLLGATGSTKGGTSQDDQATNPITGLRTVAPMGEVQSTSPYFHRPRQMVP